MKWFLHDVVALLARSRQPSSNGRRRHPPRRPSPVRRRMMIEALEDRLVPTTFNALPGAADGAAGSLRAAVIAANGNGQDNTIQLQSGLYQLSLGNAGTKQENAAATGDLDVTSAGHTLTIQGVNPSATFIDANFVDRVFQVLPNATLVLQNLTVTGGFAVDDGTTDATAFSTDSVGGGILNHGKLTLDHVRLENNIASATFIFPPQPGTKATNAAGGGVFSDGKLTVADSTVANNSAFGGKGGAGDSNLAMTGDPGEFGGFADGGGLAVEAGTATINNSTISGNTARGGGGGAGGAGGDGFINGPGKAGGAGAKGGPGAGGGLYVANSGTKVTLSSSSVTGNTAQGGNGGAGGKGGNGAAAGDNGGAAGAGASGGTGAGGGIAVVVNGSVTLSNTTVASNHSQGGTGGNGADGGSPGPGGSAGAGSNGGSGGTSSGGGVFALGMVNVNNSTVAMNTSDTSKGGAAGAGGAAGQDTMGQGGGVRQQGGTLNAVSSIFAQNTAANGQVDFSGNFGTAQHNLLGDNTGSNLAAAMLDANGNKVGSSGSPFDPHLLPLDNYGGPTQTLALKPDSMAIDAGANPDALTSDQRGFDPRTFGAATDIGAFEFGPATPPPPTNVVVVTVPVQPPEFHQLVTRMTRVKGKIRLDVFDAKTNARKGSIFPLGKSRGKIVLLKADFNRDNFEDLLVLATKGGKVQQRIYSGDDLHVIG
jgi:hypothetical protein